MLMLIPDTEIDRWLLEDVPFGDLTTHALGIGERIERTLRGLSLARAPSALQTFNGSDEALEYAENALLTQREMLLVTPLDRIRLSDMHLCCGMTAAEQADLMTVCLLYTSPSPRDGLLSRMPSSA